jgi:hypothetical protein
MREHSIFPNQYIESLQKFIDYLDKANKGVVTLNDDLYYKGVLVAKKGYIVPNIEPKLLYRANQIFDDLMVHCTGKEVTEFLEAYGGIK